jgi:hypothetical protein
MAFGFSTQLERLARSTRDLLNVLGVVTDKDAGFRSLRDTWADITTAHGRLMLTALGGLAEFERELIRARTGEGRKRAKVRGVILATRFLQRPAIAKQLLQRHWDSERVPAQFGNSVACGTMISGCAFYPTVPDHVTEYSFACRRQSLMWRPLRLHELLQNVPLPHVGIGTAHFAFIFCHRTEIPSQRTIGLYQQRRQRHFARPQTVLPSRTIKIHLHRVWNARRRAF